MRTMVSGLCILVAPLVSSTAVDDTRLGNDTRLGLGQMTEIRGTGSTSSARKDGRIEWPAIMLEWFFQTLPRRPHCMDGCASLGCSRAYLAPRGSAAMRSSWSESRASASLL